MTGWFFKPIAKARGYHGGEVCTHEPPCSHLPPRPLPPRTGPVPACVEAIERCSTCRYEMDLDCRRYPPMATTDYDGMRTAQFPRISSGNWCGEYQRRPTAEPTMPIHLQNPCG